ncbi:Glu/Leu/Phe/Val dehydrogenase dimerization domain-containing protein [Lysinibacillus sp. CTST325]
MSAYKVILCDPEIDLEAFIVIDSIVNGMSAGGLRMTSNVTLEEVEQLAQVMTKKYIISGVHMGGAKSGIVYDPNKHDRERLLKRFAELAKPFLTENYLVGEDLGITGDDIEFIYNSISFDPIATMKNKLESQGLTVNVPQNTSLKVLFNAGNSIKLVGSTIINSTQIILKKLDKSIENMRVGIQGFGTIGQVSAEAIYNLGGKIISIEDKEGCIYYDDGLDIPDLISKTNKTGIIDRTLISENYILKPNGTWLDDAELLIPAAIKHSINESNVDRVNASIIIEAANLPIEIGIEERLINKGIIIVPDFICNSGAAAFFGMLASGQANFEDIFEKVETNVNNSFNDILEHKSLFNCDIREFANQYVLKIQRSLALGDKANV